VLLSGFNKPLHKMWFVSRGGAPSLVTKLFKRKAKGHLIGSPTDVRSVKIIPSFGGGTNALPKIRSSVRGEVTLSSLR